MADRDDDDFGKGRTAIVQLEGPKADKHKPWAPQQIKTRSECRSGLVAHEFYKWDPRSLRLDRPNSIGSDIMERLKKRRYRRSCVGKHNFSYISSFRAFS